jgi:deoxyribose-phosphate aldolase
METRLTIALGADHGGFELKERLHRHLVQLGHAVRDCGTTGTAPVDYPVIALEVARRVSAGSCDIGIMIDGAGIGSAIAANKVRGVRAAACYNDVLARNSREHNDANVLTLGAGQTGFEAARSIVEIFLSTACTAERHLARVRLIGDYEAGTMSQRREDRDVPLSPEDIGRIADKVRTLLAEGRGAAPAGAAMSPDRLARLIDHTLLRPEATATDIDRLCAEALKYTFFSVCVNPANVQQAKKLLQGSSVRVCCVVGFPLGAQAPESKALEARRAIRDGAQEIDMVINIGSLKSGDDALVLRDIRRVVEACEDGRAACKVILETALLTDEEKVKACELSMKAGADFVKTSTGFSSGGATVEDVALMSRTVAPRKLGVKASGGIRTYTDVVRMVGAGATRVGCSSSVKIMEEAIAMVGRKE